MTRPEFRVGPDGALANVLVAAMPKEKGTPQEPPAEPAVLRNYCIVMEPRVVVLITGQRLVVRNEEPVLHNFHPIPRTNPEVMAVFQKAGDEKSLTFKKAELGIPAKCDVHAWERAWIHVLDHPYFAVTGDDGTFEIRGLPPGEYRLIAWHEVFGENPIEPTLRIGHGVGANLELTFETRRK